MVDASNTLLDHYQIFGGGNQMNSTGPQLTIQTVLNPFEIYTDSRTHGYQGPSRNVRLSRVTAAGGGGAIAKSEDGTRCAVAGKDCKFASPKLNYILI